MFCACPNDLDGAAPNTHICAICTGQPGTMPAANMEAIRLVLKTGIALGAQILPRSKFDRKNYFYPDLPKGYQISQYDLPLCQGGCLELAIGDQKTTIRIRRITSWKKIPPA